MFTRKTRLALSFLSRRASRSNLCGIKFYGAFVLNCRVVLHAIDATPARRRGDAGFSPLDRARTAASSPRNDLVHPTHWLISTQPLTLAGLLLAAALGGQSRLYGGVSGVAVRTKRR